MIAPAHPSDGVLLIEDDPLIRDATVRLLRKKGYTAFGATNGVDALHFLHSHDPPCVILLDLQMPEMDGWQFRRRQQADPALNKIPVLILSSYENVEEIAEALRAKGCLHKPIEEKELDDALREFPRH